MRQGGGLQLLAPRRRRVRSVTFIIGDTGPGVLRTKRLALVPGHQQLGWPLHAATERPSLPPLQ